MKFVKSLAVVAALAVSSLLSVAQSAQAVEMKDAPVIAFSGANAAMVFLGPSGMGPTMFGGALVAIAYCQSQMQKDAAGYVTYQAPECNGGSATPVVGNLTQNPYNKVGKKCIPLPQGGYNCEN